MMEGNECKYEESVFAELQKPRLKVLDVGGTNLFGVRLEEMGVDGAFVPEVEPVLLAFQQVQIAEDD